MAVAHASDSRREALKERLRAFFAHPATDHTVAVLIVISVALLFLEFTSIGAGWAHWLGDLVTLVFVVELSARCYAARSRAGFLREYWIDILSVIPLFRSWRLLRVLRLLRLFRLAPMLARSNRRVASVLRASIGEQFTILSVIVVTVLVVSYGLLTVESANPDFETLEQTLWWAVFSLIAGEPIEGMPETMPGRMMLLVVMVAGLTVFALFTGTVSAIMAERFRNGIRSNLMNIEELSGHLLICGWNRSGPILLDEFRNARSTAQRAIVVVAEREPRMTEEQAADPHVYFLEGDYTRSDMLLRAGVRRAKRAILLADRSIPDRSDQDRDARTVLAGMMIEKLSPGIFTCAELLSRENEQPLLLAGIEEVVIGDEYSAKILASSSRVRGVTQIVDDVFSYQHENQLHKRTAHADWVGKTVLEVQGIIKRDYGALFLALERARDTHTTDEGVTRANAVTNPAADTLIEKGDVLVVIASAPPHW